MCENDEELQVILLKLQEYHLNYPVTESDFLQPTSHFVITLCSNLINKIYKKVCTFINSKDIEMFSAVMSLNPSDEESTIFAIYNFIKYTFQYLGLNIFSLHDLHYPKAKRTKCVCKVLLLCLDNLIEKSDFISYIQNKISSEAENENLLFEKKSELQRLLGKKANAVGILKNETDELHSAYKNVQKKEAKFKEAYEEEKKALELQHNTLRQYNELLKKDEEELEKLEKEESNLLQEIINSEDVEAVIVSINTLEKEITTHYEEQIKGFEDNLENKKHELNVYEEVNSQLDKLQDIDTSQLEHLHKMHQDIKNNNEEILSKKKTIEQLKRTKAEQIDKNKQQKRQAKDKMKALMVTQEQLITDIAALEEKKKHKMKSLSALFNVEEGLMKQMNAIEQSLESIQQEYEESEIEFQEACNKITSTANKTTEDVTSILKSIERTFPDF